MRPTGSMFSRVLITSFLVFPAAITARAQFGEFAAPVVVAEVTEVSMPQRISLFGTLEPFRRSRVAAETEGVLEEFPFVEGDHVAAGCVIARVRTRTLELRRLASLAALSSASAELERLENGYRPEEIEAARFRVIVLEALASDTEKDLERTRSLLPEGAATVEDLDKSRILLAAATARLAEASVNLAMMQRGYRDEEIAAARAQVREREAELARVEEEIAEASTRAPYSGLVAEKLTELGEWLGTGDPVVEMIQLDPVLVHVDVPERYLSGLRLGRKAAVSVDALPGYYNQGEVTRIVPQANLSARTFGIKIRLPNSDGRLLAGMLARVDLEVGEPRLVRAVPKDAIVLGSMGNAVFIVNEGRAKMIPVEVGDAYQGLVEVEGAVEVGASVVVRGNERLREGQAVSIEGSGGSPPQAGVMPPG